MKETREKSKNS